MKSNPVNDRTVAAVTELADVAQGLTDEQRGAVFHALDTVVSGYSLNTIPELRGAGPEGSLAVESFSRLLEEIGRIAPDPSTNEEAGSD